MQTGNLKSSYSTIQKVGLVMGPTSFLLTLLLVNPEGLSGAGVGVMATTLWVAWWWLTEAVPMAGTGLVPIVLFPVMEVLPIGDTTSAYTHPMIFLFLGGFVLALAMEKWNLHRRIALSILSRVGSQANQVVLGFMIATGFLSMWISNTATTVMMLPIGMAVIGQMVGEKEGMSGFGKALMLGIAYSASIGGMATLVGTPTNPILSGIVEQTYGVEISFAKWMVLGVPLTLVLTLFTWWYLTRVAFKLDANITGLVDFSQQRAALGRMKMEEKVVLWVFVGVAVLWMGGRLVRTHVLPGMHDTAVAIAGALILFIWPAKSDKGSRVMNWEDTERLPWGILLLFGGGLCIARGFTRSGLADWIGQQLSVLDRWELLIIILAIVALVNFLTEVTSNVATASMILPILAALAKAIEVHPFYLMVGATLAASCAFMLPVATAPNAVVFGARQLRIPDMVRTGFVLNLASVVLITLIVYFVMPLVWDLDISLLGAD